jgi:hypothetical protein
MHTVMLASVGALAVCVTLPALAAEQNCAEEGALLVVALYVALDRSAGR